MSANLTQEQLAEKMNLTRQAVSNWENEKTCPDIDTIMRLAEVLDIDVMFLLYGPAYQKRQIEAIPKDKKKIRILIILITLEVIIFMALIAFITRLLNQSYSIFCSYLRPVMIYLFCEILGVTIGILFGTALKDNSSAPAFKRSKKIMIQIAMVLSLLPVSLLALQSLLLLVWHNAPQPINIAVNYVLVHRNISFIVLFLLPALGGACIENTCGKKGDFKI